MSSEADSTDITGIADITENESERFQRFKMMTFHAIEQIASGVSEEEFCQLLGKLSVLSKSKTAPIRLQKKMRGFITNCLTAEMNELIKEAEIPANFNKLDEIIEKCALHEGETAWRPNGNVTDHMRSHAMEVKMKHLSALQEEVRRREQTTEALCHEVSSLRHHVTSLSSKLQAIREHNMDCELLDSLDAKILSNE